MLLIGLFRGKEPRTGHRFIMILLDKVMCTPHNRVEDRLIPEEEDIHTSLLQPLNYGLQLMEIVVMPRTKMPEEERKRRAKESTRKWREANPDKVRAAGKAWTARNREKVRGINKKSREKNKDKIKARRAANRDKRANSSLLYHYGITLEEKREMIAEQKGLCAICARELVKKLTHVDHCHKTGVIRGILCNNCNTGIGMLKDDPKLLRAAIEYLTEDRT